MCLASWSNIHTGFIYLFIFRLLYLYICGDILKIDTGNMGNNMQQRAAGGVELGVFAEATQDLDSHGNQVSYQDTSSFFF